MQPRSQHFSKYGWRPYFERGSSFCTIFNRNYHSFEITTHFITGVRIQCPADIKIVLPLGASNMSLALSKLNIKLDLQNIRSVPDGVLTGKYKFTSRFNSQVVKLIPTSPTYQDDSCTFHVTVQGELPSIKELYVASKRCSNMIQETL